MGVNRDFWRDRRVLVTGHTGFKGAWLSAWLSEMGAIVAGMALAPASEPNLFQILDLDRRMTSEMADITDRSAVAAILAAHRPDIVFHLAAQAIVRASYQDPVTTFATNVGGVVMLLDAVRHISCVRAVVVVTSDKCYDNQEWVWGYREHDRLGGRDPYSASKSCAEIAARSMRMSYYAPYVAGGHPARIATVRAGNVIGGGDWSVDRLVPDIIRGCLGPRQEVHLRNPQAIRPWQHVLDPLAAYLTIAEQLVTSPDGFDEGWNIGPDSSDNRAVQDVADTLVAALGIGRIICDDVPQTQHEAHLLMLDCAKARIKLGWQPRLRFDEAIRFTADWYAAWHDGQDMAAYTSAQIAAFNEAGRSPI